MSGVDARGCTISGATPTALEAYERALAAFQSWRTGADEHLAPALQEAPGFVMAHVLQAYCFFAVAIRSASGWRVRCWRAPPRCPPMSANDCTLPRSRRRSPIDYERAKARSASCCVGIRAMCSRCKWRMRSTTSPAIWTA